jgi:hypothetical protein
MAASVSGGEPDLELSFDGKEVFPKKYREFSWETITSEDIVTAVLPLRTFTGKAVQTVPGDRSKKGDEGSVPKVKAANNSFPDSVVDAEHQLENALSIYGVQIATIPSYVESSLTILRRENQRLAQKFPPLQAHRRNIPGKKKTRLLYYYCRRCLRLQGFDSGDPDRVGFSMVAACRLQRRQGEDSAVQAELTVEKLFPHDRICSLADPDLLPSNYLDQNNGGSGAQIVQFPIDNVLGDLFTPLIKKVDRFPPGECDLPVGTQIFLDPSPGQVQAGKLYPFDRRRYEHIPTKNTFFREVIGTEDLRQKTIRLWFWIAGKFSISDQMHYVQTSPFVTNGGTKVFPRWPLEDPSNDLGIVCHLRLNGLSALWGGHQKGDMKVDQLYHIDIPEKKKVLIKEGSTEEVVFDVSTNPSLQGLFKPGGFIIPLQDSRTLITLGQCQVNEDEITRGHLIYFCGDYAHAGMTYSSEDPSWHFSLHVYLDSAYHARSHDDSVKVMIESVAQHEPEHAKYLDVKTVERMEDHLAGLVARLDLAIAGNPTVKKRKRTTRRKK